MNIEIYENKLTVDSYIEIKKTAFKINNSKLQIEKSLKNDLYDVVAIDGNKLVGMGRIVGDGAIYWYLQDIVVIPEYQGKGIGRIIVKKLMDYIYNNSLSDTKTTIGLMAAKGKEEFYKKFGFIERQRLWRYAPKKGKS